MHFDDALANAWYLAELMVVVLMEEAMRNANVG
jgi:hypothetical protein